MLAPVWLESPRMTVSAMKAALSLLAAVIKIKTFITQSSQSVSPVLTWPTGTIHHLTLRSASSSLRQTLFKWGLKKFHSRNPSKQNKYLRYLIFGLFLYEKTYSKHEFPTALRRVESTKQNNKQVVGWSESPSTLAVSVMMYDVNTNIVTVATSLISSAQQSTLQTCPSN